MTSTKIQSRAFAGVLEMIPKNVGHQTNYGFMQFNQKYVIVQKPFRFVEFEISDVFLKGFMARFGIHLTNNFSLLSWNQGYDILKRIITVLKLNPSTFSHIK